MNRLSYALTVCAVVSFANMVFGVGESKIAEPLRVMLELTDGSRVIGEPVTSSIALQTAYAALNRAGKDREGSQERNIGPCQWRETQGRIEPETAYD